MANNTRCAGNCACVAVDRAAEGGGDAYPLEIWAVTHKELLLPWEAHANEEEIGTERCDFAEDGLFFCAVFGEIAVVRADDL